MPEKINLGFAFGLPPEKAVEYFQEKGYRFSWDWRETRDAAHAKAFTVAKAMRMDVLQDLKDGVRKALSEGTTERDFIKDLTPKLQAMGWWGKKWVGDGDGGAQQVQLGSPRRLKTIYRTNLQSAYMAGRWKQMEENAPSRPYWQYVAVLDGRTRPAHRALNGLVFRHDDPFWDTHYPPLGYNCRCRIRALSQTRLDAKGLQVESSTGALHDEDVQVSKATGELRTVTGVTAPRTNATVSPDPGFNFNQGKAAWQPDLEKFDYDLAKQYLEGAITGPGFQRFIAGTDGGTFPVAVIAAEMREAIGAKSQVVLLSTETRLKNVLNHPEMTLADYQALPDIVDQAQLVVQDGTQTFVFLRVNDKLYYGAIKATRERRENYLTSFRLARKSDIATIRRKGKVIRDEL